MSYYTYSDPSYTTYVTASTASLGVGMLIFYLIVLALCIVSIVALWKMYKKAGEHGWACLVPFYNNYVFYRMTWGNGWMFLLPTVLIFGYVFGLVFLMLSGFAGEAVLTIIMTILAIGCGIASIVINIITLHKLSKSFGHGVGFTLGLLFLSVIFYIILGFGSSQYVGPSSKHDNAIELM